MNKKNLYKNERFDSYLNKTIILSSKLYFKRQMNIKYKENTIMDNDNYYDYLQSFIGTDCPLSFFDVIESNLELNNALNCLSGIEQAVIFLLFNKDLSQAETAEILDIYTKTVSKIKIRAIKKLRKYMEGDYSDEK